MKTDELQKHMREHSLDYSLLFAANNSRLRPNFYYFSQFEGDGAVVVPRKGAQKLIVSRLDSALKATVWSKGTLFDFVRGLMKRKPKQIGIDKDNLTLKALGALKQSFRHTTFVNLSEVCNALRKTKVDAEVTKIRRACAITQEILGLCIEQLNQFKKETDVAAFLKIQALERNCPLAFEPVVASGEFASIPHHKARPVKLRNGFCIIDFGVRYRGYCADLTRTVFIGKPNRQQRDMFEKTTNTQQEIIEAIRPGDRTDVVYEMVRKKLGSSLIHSPGHGVGIEVHEQPFFGEENAQEILEGMVVSVEPGMYAPRKFGIRIEDMVHVTRKKAQLLSKQQELITVSL